MQMGRGDYAVGAVIEHVLKVVVTNDCARLKNITDQPVVVILSCHFYHVTLVINHASSFGGIFELRGEQLISFKMTAMRAILIKDGKGPIENLYIGETATPVVKSGEVLVKVRTSPRRGIRASHVILRKSRQIKAFSLNRMDVSQRQGFYPVPQDAPEILGVEFAGHVTAFGPDTSATWAIGDQVLGLASGVSTWEYPQFQAGTKLQTMLGRLCRICCCTRNADSPQAAAIVLVGGRKHSRGIHHRRVPTPSSQYGPIYCSSRGSTLSART